MNFILGSAMGRVGLILGRIAQAISFNFDAAKVTFTAGCAKRNGSSSGPFAAGIMSQGTVKSSNYDSIAFSNTALIEYFHKSIDTYQGSVVFWITPEWNGNDGTQHAIFAHNGNYHVSFEKSTGNQLRFWIGAPGTHVIAVDVSSWVAGNTYCVVGSWDYKRRIDGTNFIRVSVNDVHTFGGTYTWAQSTMVSNGSYLNGTTNFNKPADALIEGFTIYRRVLFDGSYGVDVGNGDEVSRIYNAGSGTDPCDITGSWDVTFCLPTDAVTGAVATGTGNAWSHPHDSEVLADAFCQTAYASSAWADVGTPVAIPSVAFTGGNTYIDAGSEASIDNLTDNEVTIEGWFRGTNINTSVVAKGTSSSAGWIVFIDMSGYLNFRVMNTTPTMFSVTALPKIIDNAWHHFVAYFNDAGNRYPYLAVDGIWYKGSSALTGTVYDDSGYNMCLGRRGDPAWFLYGGMGWFRISNNARYTVGTNFIPPSRTALPANDANTVRLFYMNEGTGTTITDSSTNAQNGTLTNGSWSTVRDMITSAPGERIYNWGYEFGSDAANEGFSQTLAGLTAGNKYVIRPVLHYDKHAVPIVKVLDATNSDALITSLTYPNQQTELVTNGGFDSDAGSWTAGASATLSSEAGGVSGNCLKVLNGAASQGYAYQSIQLAPYATYRLTWWHKNGDAQGKVSVGTSAGGTQLYNGGNTNDSAWAQKTITFITSPTGLAVINFWQGTTTNAQYTYFDSVTIARVVSVTVPAREPFSFELPTVARHGVANDCTSIKVQVLNTATSGIVSVHQVELLSNLLDNPSFDIGAGNPWIPSGWTNVGLDTGDSEEETALAHSAGKAAQFNTGAAAGEQFEQSVAATAGKFIGYGGMSCGDGTKRMYYRAYNAEKQTVATSSKLANFNGLYAPAWGHAAVVIRVVESPIDIYPYLESGGVGIRYVDDFYAILLNDYTLTITPSTLAQSTETSGLRVDGYDSCAQPNEGQLSATSGTVKFKWTPRHSSADSLKYIGGAAQIVQIKVSEVEYITASITIIPGLLSLSLVSPTITGADATAMITFVAGTTYDIELTYDTSSIRFYMNSVLQATVTLDPGEQFSSAPTSVQFGSRAGVYSGDATFAAP